MPAAPATPVVVAEASADVAGSLNGFRRSVEVIPSDLANHPPATRYFALASFLAFRPSLRANASAARARFTAASTCAGVNTSTLHIAE